MAKKPGHGEKRTRKEDLLIVNLLSESSIQKAAEKTGISPNTAFLWLQCPDFQRKYAQARARVADEAFSRIQTAATGAVEALVEVLEDTDAPASARVAASRTILENLQKIRETDILAARIKDLEESIQTDLRLIR